MPLGASFFEDVPLVGFIYLVFTRTPGGVTVGDSGLWSVECSSVCVDGCARARVCLCVRACVFVCLCARACMCV